MNLDEILVKVQETVCEKTSVELSFDDILMENGLDSVSIIELIINIEELFDIEFESSELNYKLLKSIRTISEYIHHTINGDFYG